MSKDNDFIIIGCDGIWDCLQDQDACDIINKNINSPGNNPFKINLSQILGDICDSICAKNIFALGGVGYDNMSIILIQFK